MKRAPEIAVGIAAALSVGIAIAAVAAPDQAESVEVSELARDGMVAMMRAARANMMSRASR